jgi:hypothetical protein
MSEERPFWAEEPALKDDESVPESDVVGAVPKMKYVVGKHIVARWGIHEGVLNYHLYMKERKDILDRAEAAMEDVRLNDQLQPQQKAAEMDRIAAAGNAELTEHPWPNGFADITLKQFADTLKGLFHEPKLDYFAEVDSYSLAMPEPQTPLRVPDDVLEEPLRVIDGVIAAL